MSKRGEHLTASELAIDSYLEELLQEPTENTGSRATEANDQYRIFSVSGLLVAVPAARVGAEMARPQSRQKPGSPEWLRWTVSGNREQALVDIALLILPDDLAPRKVPLEDRCDRVLTLDDGNWGIALEGPIHEEVIDPDPVCWRGPEGRRPWLAGTLADRRCVLLDLGNIRQLAMMDSELPGLIR